MKTDKTNQKIIDELQEDYNILEYKYSEAIAEIINLKNRIKELEGLPRRVMYDDPQPPDQGG